MIVGSPEWERDDMLRVVSNGLHLRLDQTRKEKEQARRAFRAAEAEEDRIVADIKRIRRVREELKDEAR